MKKIEVGFWNHTTRAGLVLRTCWHGGSRSICKGKSTPAENNIIHTIGGEGHREGGRRMSLTNPNGWQNEVDSKRISGSALTPGTSLTEDFAREKNTPTKAQISHLQDFSNTMAGSFIAAKQTKKKTGKAYRKTKNSFSGLQSEFRIHLSSPQGPTLHPERSEPSKRREWNFWEIVGKFQTENTREVLGNPLDTVENFTECKVATELAMSGRWMEDVFFFVEGRFLIDSSSKFRFGIVTSAAFPITEIDGCFSLLCFSFRSFVSCCVGSLLPLCAPVATDGAEMIRERSNACGEYWNGETPRTQTETRPHPRRDILGTRNKNPSTKYGHSLS